MSNPYGYIYKVTNVVTGKSYIGQTVNSVNLRWQQHYSKAKTNPSNSYLGKAINKYSKDVFQVDLLDSGFDKWDLDQLEIHYIKTLNTMTPNGYNLKEGGSAGRLSEESLKKMSESKKGKPSWNKGTKASEEHRKKLSEAQKGRVPYNRKKVIDSNGNVYLSLHEAARKLGLKSPASISLVLSGKQKTAAGLSFSYLDTQQTNIA